MTLPPGIGALPNAIQVEPTEGCNLRCAFCGIRGIRPAGEREALSGPYHFMSAATGALLAHRLRTARLQELNWNPRIELAMHGEPTLNPHLTELISLLRAAMPSSPILLTTNGIPLLPTWEQSLIMLYEAGTSTVAVDNYKPYRCEVALLGTRIPGVTVLRYPEDPRGNPHRRPLHQERRLILMQDISEASSGTHHHISNHAGAAAPPDPSYRNKRCALPFRELSIRWDGSVALCCNDWRGTYKVSSIQESLHDIWNAPAFNAARRKLYHAQRDFGPCDGCTHLTYRNGLLPDRNGKNTLPLPDADDAALIREALSGGTLTPVVLRRWEKGLEA